MSLINTGPGKITGVVLSTDNGLLRWDGITGELVKDSTVTINDAGDLTANKFIGDGSLLTNVPGGDGSGDVVGPSVSIDFRVPTFNGITGRLLRQSPVSIGDDGDVFGVTKITVGKLTIEDINSDTLTNFLSTVPIRFNGDFTVWTGGNASTSGSLTGGSMMLVDQRLITTGANMDMNLEPNGSGDLIISANTIINYDTTAPAITAISSVGTVGLRIKQGKADHSTIIDFYKETSVRKGWFGYGSSGDRNGMFVINDIGDITITPKNSSGVITHTGFTKLGDTINHPEIKIKMLKGTTSGSSTGSIQIPHGVLGASIVAIYGLVHHATNSGITPGYEAGGGSFDWDVWHDGTNVHVINNGSNIAGKQVSIIIMHLST